MLLRICNECGWDTSSLSAHRYPESSSVVLAARLIVIGLTSLAGGSCSWGPISDITSLSPAVQSSTLGYNDAAGDSGDRILVTNILRAKDFSPLNLSQLSSVSGALNLTGSLGFTLPFGPAGFASNSKMFGQKSATPSVMSSTTPTYTVTPLNTQGFTLTILQPVSANYVLGLLQDGLPREILFLLSVKEIDFPSGGPGSSSYRYINDPDDPDHFNAFLDLIAELVRANVVLKAVDVLEPAGPEFALHAAGVQTTTYTDQTKNPPAPSPSTGSTYTVQTTGANLNPTYPPDNADPTGFGMVTGSSDGQYHVGNSPGNRGQLFRVYAGQIVMCVEPRWIGQHHIPPLVAPYRGFRRFSEKDRERSEQVPAPGRVQLASLTPVTMTSDIPLRGDGAFDIAAEAPAQSPVPLAPPSPPVLGAPPAAPSSSGAPSRGGGGAAAPSGSTPSQATLPALQALRTSALVSGDCQRDQVILHGFSDDEFSRKSETFVHVYWRSVTEIFQYLGAILRYNARQQRPFFVPVLPDPAVAARSATRVWPASAGLEHPQLQSSVLFELHEGGLGRLSVSYNGRDFAVGDVDPRFPKADFTRPILTMLSSLVNLASQPSAIQTSTPIRLLPLP